MRSGEHTMAFNRELFQIMSDPDWICIALCDELGDLLDGELMLRMHRVFSLQYDRLVEEAYTK